LSHPVEGSPDFGEPLRKWRDIHIGKLVDILAFECRVRWFTVFVYERGLIQRRCLVVDTPDNSTAASRHTLSGSPKPHDVTTLKMKLDHGSTGTGTYKWMMSSARNPVGSPILNRRRLSATSLAERGSDRLSPTTLPGFDTGLTVMIYPSYVPHQNFRPNILGQAEAECRI
jgi:hypothetical protein